MTLPKKQRGFRKITIEGQNFNWRLDRVIDIRPEAQKDNKMEVDFGWFDEWLYSNDKENRPADFQPKIITPAFVSQALMFGLENGWDIQKKSGLFRLKYTNGGFEVNNL